MSGTLFVISSPSGGGKTSLIHAAINRLNNINVAISHTTRKKRSNEKEGEHYYFITPQKFTTMLANNLFIEHATIFGNQYGTSKQEIAKQLSSNQDVILEIDWQGAKQILGQFKTVSIFILPPSMDSLQQRLTTRNQDTNSSISIRVDQAKIDMRQYKYYDYVVINDDFAQSVTDLITIIQSSNLTTNKQQKQHSALFRTLLN